MLPEHISRTICSEFLGPYPLCSLLNPGVTPSNRGGDLRAPRPAWERVPTAYGQVLAVRVPLVARAPEQHRF